ncbi:NAD-binding protein [Kitasatospora sp. GAS1066B]|uniref:NAD-binding protein n=1 Tax=Kitasatospora sp. GAS1066B TaxID=3156271 RepID=UPI0035194233
MHNTSAGPATSDREPDTGGFVVIGTTNLTRRVCAALRQQRRQVHHLPAPDDQELGRALAGRPAGVAVLTRDDVTALRYALAVRHLSPAAPVVVTVFDRTIAQQLQALLPHCTTLSPAELLAPTLAGLCAAPDLLALSRTGHAVRRQDGRPTHTAWQNSATARWRSLLGRLSGQLRPHDADTRMFLGGLAGITAVLGLDWAWLCTAFHEPVGTAFVEAARVVTAVGPAVTHPGHTAYQAVSGAMMLATLGFTALLTAGLVNRMSGPRLVGILGPRALPRSGHVLVVGLGHVGIRLCQALHQLRIPVVAIERDPTAAHLRLARSLGIPVVLAHGEDRHVLQRLGLHRARALAAMGSDELDNIAVAVAAHGAAPGVRVVLRAGENEAIAETRSLLPLGHTRDVTRASAAFIVAQLTGGQPEFVVADIDCDYLELPGKGLVASPVPARDDCDHIAAWPPEQPDRPRADATCS